MGKPTSPSLAADAAAFADNRITHLAIGTDNTAETGLETSLTNEVKFNNGLAASSVGAVATVSAYSDPMTAQVVIAETGAYGNAGADLFERDVLPSTVTVEIGQVAVVSMQKTYQAAA